MSTISVIVTEPSRAKKWLEAIGTTIVPIKSIVPTPSTVRDGARFLKKEAYEVDVKALTLPQQAGLIAQKAREWDCDNEDARSMIYQMGIGIMTHHCILEPEPQPNRTERKGEYEVTAADTPDTCESCKAPIVWHKLGPGRFMPLSIKTIEQDAGGRRFALSHFADCPNAAQHRKKQNGRTTRDH